MYILPFGVKPVVGTGERWGLKRGTTEIPRQARNDSVRGVPSAAYPWRWDGRRQTGGTPVQRRPRRTGRMRGAGTGFLSARGRWSVYVRVPCELAAQERVRDGCAVGKHSARLVRLGSGKLSMTTGRRDVLVGFLGLTNLSDYDMFSAVV
jgi:hypothetical protein